MVGYRPATLADVRSLAWVVRETRLARGLSEGHAASLAGTTRNDLRSIEQGLPDVPIGQVVAVLHALDLQLDVDDRETEELHLVEDRS